ncbi:MAG: cell division protein ZapA [Spongiibacteraceae bacterium]|nr:cell division protein ZapA [Spongiibacteraceae bacterium]
MSSDTVVVKLLDKDYQVACPSGQHEALLQSAHHLDEQMRSIRSQGKVIGLERIAVMAALNITNELLQKKADADNIEDENSSSGKQLKSLNDKIDSALHRFRQLELN